jgi:alpha-tubulin suppressor-like RCC1 family protein
MRLRLLAAVGAILAASILTVGLSAAPAGATPFTYVSVSTGYHRTCAVTTDGRGLCWGWNHSGSLGTADRSSTVLTPSLIALPDGERFRDIEAGSYFTSCGLTRSANVYCWGESGTPTRFALPNGSVVSQLSVGASQVCALTVDRQLYCHGDWNSGELGVGEAEYTHLPVRVQLPDAAIPAFVSAGIGFTCVVATSGVGYCSGVNAAGQLGNGGAGTTKVFTRIAMPTGIGFTSISAGLERACAVDTNGGAWCWGQNYNGALGDDTYAHSRTPRPVTAPTGTTIVDVQTGWYHTCAITDAGATLCWGSNDQGALGWGQTYGGKTIRTAALPDGVSARQLEVGLAGTCITATDGRIFCWGTNLRGSVGNGTASPVYSPTEVLRVGTPDAAQPTVENVSTHSVSISGSFVPNGATTSVTVLVAATTSFEDARSVTVPLRRTQQSSLAQLFAPVTFTASIAGLRPAIKYHVKIRATNTFGSDDSVTTSFVTLGAAPTIGETSATDVAGESAIIGTTVDANLLDTSARVVYATDETFTRDVRSADLGVARGDGETGLGARLPDLAPRTEYFVRVEASNEVGSAVGDTISFTTIGDAPAIDGITTSGGRRSATVTVELDPGDLRTRLVVEYRPTGTASAWAATERSAEPNATTVTIPLSTLLPAATYEVKVTAVNAVGSASTQAPSFTTSGGAPALTATQARDVADTTVTLRTSVDTNEFATRVTLQIDTDETFANFDEWFAGSAAAGSTTQISLDVSELIDSTDYYARFVAVNKMGTTISDVVAFTTTTPVGKLLKRRIDPVDPEPIVTPTPPSASTPPSIDQPVETLLVRPLATRVSPKAALKSAASKSIAPKKAKKSAVKLSVRKRSIAR